MKLHIHTKQLDMKEAIRPEKLWTWKISVKFDGDPIARYYITPTFPRVGFETENQATADAKSALSNMGLQ